MPNSNEPRDQFIRRQREASVDHDLLITLNVKLDNITAEMGIMKTETLARMVALEATAVRKTELDKDVLSDVRDHETRLRRLEVWCALAIGALTVVQVALQFLNVGLK